MCLAFIAHRALVVLQIAKEVIGCHVSVQVVPVIKRMDTELSSSVLIESLHLRHRLPCWCTSGTLDNNLSTKDSIHLFDSFTSFTNIKFQGKAHSSFVCSCKKLHTVMITE